MAAELNTVTFIPIAQVLGHTRAVGILEDQLQIALLYIYFQYNSNNRIVDRLQAIILLPPNTHLSCRFYCVYFLFDWLESAACIITGYLVYGFGPAATICFIEAIFPITTNV